MKKLTSLIMLSSVLFAVENQNTSITQDIEQKTKKVMEDLKTTKNPIQPFVKGTIVQSNYSSGDSYLQPYTIENDPVFVLTAGVSALPDSINLTASYSIARQSKAGNLFSDRPAADRGTNEPDGSYTFISIKPFKYIGFSYEDYQYLTRIKNTSNNYIELMDKLNDGYYPTGVTSTDSINMFIAPNETYEFSNYEKKYSVSFHAGKDNFEYLPNYFLAKFYYVQGNKIWPGVGSSGSFAVPTSSMAVQSDTKGFGGGFGIEKTMDELSNGFNFKKFFLYGLGKPFSFTQEAKLSDGSTLKKDTGRQGVEAEVVYLFNKNFYILGGLDYQLLYEESFDNRINNYTSYNDTNIVSKIEFMWRF